MSALIFKPSQLAALKRSAEIIQLIPFDDLITDQKIRSLARDVFTLVVADHTMPGTKGRVAHAFLGMNVKATPSLMKGFEEEAIKLGSPELRHRAIEFITGWRGIIERSKIVKVVATHPETGKATVVQRYLPVARPLTQQAIIQTRGALTEQTGEEALEGIPDLKSL